MAAGGFVKCMKRSLLQSDSEGSRARPASETTLSSFGSLVGEQLVRKGDGAISSSPSAATPSADTPTSAKKRVMVVIDASPESRQATLWALSHVVHRSDILSLLHFRQSGAQKTAGLIFSRPNSERLQALQERFASGESVAAGALELGKSLKTLCTSRRPEVEVEVMTVEGMDKALTIVTQAKKLEATILVLGQRKPSLFQRVFSHKSTSDEVIDYCIQNSECLTLAVRKKSKHMNGYLINSRWQKNFWLLA